MDLVAQKPLSIRVRMVRCIMGAMGGCCLLGSLHAQDMRSAMGHYYELIRQTFEERNAYNTVLFMDQYWRVTGNKGFNESIFHVEKILQHAGFVKEIHGEADGPLTYRIESSPLQQPAWEPEQAQLMLQGADTPLLAYCSNRNMLAIYSASTPPQGINAEVVYIGAGEEKDFERNDLRGKIAFAEGQMDQVYGPAVKHGAIGVLAYSVPQFNRPQQHPNAISFQSIPYSDTAKWGILLSYAARETLKAALQHGPVYTHVLVQAHTYPATALTLVANVRGALKPEDRFVFSAPDNSGPCAPSLFYGERKLLP